MNNSLKNNELHEKILKRITKSLDEKIIILPYSQKIGEIEEAIPIYDSTQKIPC